MRWRRRRRLGWGWVCELVIFVLGRVGWGVLLGRWGGFWRAKRGVGEVGGVVWCSWDLCAEVLWTRD